jgi:hypothetical protein
MRQVIAGLIVLALMQPSISLAQSSFAEEEFTEDDFAQFFELIEDGKISKEKIGERCRKQAIGFTFLGEDVVHPNGQQRIFYNVSREDASVDGRTFRAKHFNASFGEWSGSVFKPLCPGMYSLSVDFVTAAADKEEGKQSAEEVSVHLYLRRPDEERPGTRIVTATKTGPGARGTGHASLALPLHSGDEISTWSEAVGPNKQRVFERVTFTAVKVMHLEDYVEEIDMDAWTQEMVLLKRSAQD